MIDLDEIFGIAGPTILIDVPTLEFLWPDDMPEYWIQSTEGVDDLALSFLRSLIMLWRSS
jgi:hypothetical protein